MMRIGQDSQMLARRAQSTDCGSKPSWRKRAPADLAAARLKDAKALAQQLKALIENIIGIGGCER
jgi:hypothetical protein